MTRTDNKNSHDWGLRPPARAAEVRISLNFRKSFVLFLYFLLCCVKFMARRAVAHKLRILSVHQLSVVQVSVLHTGPARRGRTAHCGRGSVCRVGDPGWGAGGRGRGAAESATTFSHTGPAQIIRQHQPTETGSRLSPRSTPPARPGRLRASVWPGPGAL